MKNDIHVGSQVFIHMPGDYALSGTLEHFGHRHNSTIRFFHVKTPNDTFTANLQPLPVERGRNSNRVIDYRCFIPISGFRVLATFLEPTSHAQYVPGTIEVAIRFPQRNHTLYSGLMELGEGMGPEWIPRHM